MLKPIARALVSLACTPRKLVHAILVLFASCSAAYSLVEGKGPVEGAWWALVTASTVGYGDQYPATTAGRFVGAVLILGMWLLSLLAVARVTASLVPDPHVFTDDEQRRVLADLASIREAVERIESRDRTH